MKTFYAWLITQKDRKDSIGDLAKDAAGDSDFPIHGDKDDIEDYLSMVGACDGARDAFDRAWILFNESAKQPALAERDIEKKFVREVERLGGIAYKFVSPGRVGVPDRVVVLPGGRVLFVELKRDGGVLSSTQEREIYRLQKLGCSAHVVYGLHEALAVLGVNHAHTA